MWVMNQSLEERHSLYQRTQQKERNPNGKSEKGKWSCGRAPSRVLPRLVGPASPALAPLAIG
jgi:hypothetical protein